jgi:PIN domain nuclease of toxin-antitoxin system
VRLLLDTHTLIWAMTSSRLLPPSLRRQIEDGRNEVCYSAISVFEVATKRAGRSRSAPPISSDMLVELAQRGGLREIGISAGHAAAVETIAPFHPDPFDRLLLAQAQIEGLQLVTHDEDLARYDNRTIVF